MPQSSTRASAKTTTPTKRRKAASKGGGKAHASEHAHERASKQGSAAGKRMAVAEHERVEQVSSKTAQVRADDVTLESDHASQDTPISPTEDQRASGAVDIETERQRDGATDGGRGAQVEHSTNRAPGSASSDGQLDESRTNDEPQDEYKSRDRFS